MYWLRAWGQILLPVFLSVLLIQLLINFSEKGFPQISRHGAKQRAKSADEDGCALQKSCKLCLESKRCFWCNGENTCKKFCFTYSGCQLSSSFWLSCRVDMFGFLMLLLIVILVIAFIWHCCIFHYYLQEYVHFILKLQFVLLGCHMLLLSIGELSITEKIDLPEGEEGSFYNELKPVLQRQCKDPLMKISVMVDDEQLRTVPWIKTACFGVLIIFPASLRVIELPNSLKLKF